MDDDEDDFPSNVPVRPWSAPVAAAGERRQREPKSFKPTPPNERRRVEKPQLASMPGGETAGSMLQNAFRRQDLDGSGSRLRERVVHEKYQGMSLQKFGLGAGRGPAAAATGSTQRLEGITAPRKVKDKGSTELMDLAFVGGRRMADGQITKSYAPISLPYFNITEEDEMPKDGSGGGSGSKKKTRPTLKHVDEANANAARELFLSADGHLQEEQYFLMQLPAVLPELLNANEEVQREQEDAATAGAGASITRMPDGLFGKLRIHKSGKVRMEIGGLPFCVDQGCTTFFRQDLVCVCPLANEIIDLGEIRKRVVLTPDVDAMLAEASAAPPASAEEQSVAGGT